MNNSRVLYCNKFENCLRFVFNLLIPVKNPAYEMIIRSANNLVGTKTMLVNYLNIRDLLNFDKIVLPVQSLDVISAHLG